MSLVCFGEALIDFLSDGKTPETFTKFAGGAPANVAVAASKLSVPTYFVGMLGQDMFGRFLLEELSGHGVNVDYCKTTDEAKTALAFVSLDQHGERSFSFYRPPAADLLFKQSDFDDTVFNKATLFHVCSNSLTENSIYRTTVYGITQAKSAGAVISFDVNLRENLWTSTRYLIERLWHIISLSDVIKLSYEELTYLTRHSQAQNSDSDTINKILESNAKLVLVTDGANPIQYYTNNGITGEIPPPVVTAVDTTAAGDAFVGGLLSQLSTQLQEASLEAICTNQTCIEDILTFASKCGAFAVTHKGAFASLPTLADIQ